MRTREVLAVAGIAAVAGGSLEAAHEFDVDSEARALYTTTKTCALTYNARYTEGGDEGGGESLPPGIPGLVNSGTDGVSSRLVAFSFSRPDTPDTQRDTYPAVTERTLACLRAGAWIPGGVAMDTSGMRPGDPARLLVGYAELQKSRGENFNPSSAIRSALGWATLAGLIAAVYRRRKEKSQERAVTDEETSSQAA